MDVQAKALTEVFSWREAPAADFAVIGEEVSHSLSPAMHGAAFAAVGLPLRYVAINVPRREVGVALAHLRDIGYRGANVTVPHKEEARRWVSEAHLEYRNVDAVNTIHLSSRSGFNTDTVGFRESLRTAGCVPKRALVLGAGGSSRAVLAVLSESGCAVRLWNRTSSKAHQLSQVFAGTMAVEEADPSGCDLIVNATAASKLGGELPVLWERGEAGALAYDLFYSAAQTPFLRFASMHGLRTIDGVKLLVLQGAASWRCWGIETEPPVALMEEVVREALGQHA